MIQGTKLDRADTGGAEGPTLPASLQPGSRQQGICLSPKGTLSFLLLHTTEAGQVPTCHQGQGLGMRGKAEQR